MLRVLFSSVLALLLSSLIPTTTSEDVICSAMQLDQVVSVFNANIAQFVEVIESRQATAKYTYERELRSGLPLQKAITPEEYGLSVITYPEPDALPRYTDLRPNGGDYPVQITFYPEFFVNILDYEYYLFGNITDFCETVWPVPDSSPPFCSEPERWNNSLDSFQMGYLHVVASICDQLFGSSPISITSQWWLGALGESYVYTPFLPEEYVAQIYNSGLPADLFERLFSFEFLSGGDGEGTFNEVSYTPPYVDPVTNGFMISALIPVYLNSTWMGVFGQDYNLEAQSQLLPSTLTQNHTWFVALENGAIVLASEAFYSLLFGNLRVSPFFFNSTTFQEMGEFVDSFSALSVNQMTHFNLVQSDNEDQWLCSYMKADVLGWIVGIIVPVEQLDAGTVIVNSTLTSEPIEEGQSGVATITLVSTSPYDCITTWSLDVPWIKPIMPTITPSQGTARATVTFDATNMTAGTYDAIVFSTTRNIGNTTCLEVISYTSVTFKVTSGDQGVPGIVSAIVYASCFFGVFLCVGLMILTRIYEEKQSIAGIIPSYMYLNLFGGILMSISPILVAPLSRSCFAGVCLFAVGFCFFFSALAVKAWRLHRIKNAAANLQSVRITNLHLSIGVGFFLAIQGLILGLWGGISMPYKQTVEKQQFDNEIIEICSWGEHDVAFLIVEACFLGSLLVTSLILARSTRGLLEKFSKSAYLVEADEIFFAVYNFTVCIVLVAILFVSTKDTPVAWILILSIGIVAAVSLSVAALYLIRMYSAIFEDGTYGVSSASKDSTSKGTSTIKKVARSPRA